MGKHGPGKRRIMRSFKMTKIALVDDPAQEGADIVLRKRRETVIVKAKFAVMTSSEDGHSHLIDEYGDTGPFAGTTSSATSEGAESYHSHPWQVLEDGSIEIGESSGHTHVVDPLKMLAAMRSWATRGAAEQAKYAAERAAYSKRNEQGQPAADEARATEAAGDGGGQQDKSMTKQNDATAGADQAATKQTEAVQALEKRLARAEALAKLNDVSKGHLAKLADDPARERFLAMSGVEQAEELRKAATAAADQDPVEYTSTQTGRVFRKSAGADTIDLAKRLDEETGKRIASEATLRKSALRKRAEDELRHLPGTVEERAELLAAIDAHAGTNDTVRKSMLAAVKAGDKAMSDLFKARGTTTGGKSNDESDAGSKLEVLAKARVKDKGVDYFQAYADVAGENPELAAAALGGSEDAEGEL